MEFLCTCVCGLCVVHVETVSVTEAPVVSNDMVVNSG